ncbi:MAG: C-terminal binding protein [Thermomicrobiales bacterium]
MAEKFVVVRPFFQYTEGEDTTAIEQQELDAANAELRVLPFGTTEERKAALEEADGFLTSNLVTAEMIPWMPKVRAIVTTSHGYNGIDLDACTEAGIPVSNSRYNEREVATHAIGLMLAVTRKIATLHNQMAGGEWGRGWQGSMPPLYGETMGILGLGKIGRQTAKRAAAFDLHVIAHDPYVDPSIADLLNVELVDFDELFERSDYLSVHVPQNEETTGIVNERALSLMKRNAVLINTCRGPVVDEESLYNVLSSGRIRGAGLDVFEVEPTPSDNPILKLDNVVLTPHIAGFSNQSVLTARRGASHKMAQMLNGYYPNPLLNPDVRTHTRVPYKDFHGNAYRG